MADTLGFVPPRYGADVVGGAEAVMSELAHGFAARGHDVEVLTTCARDHFTWANAYPAGVSRDGAVRVRRFPTAGPDAPADRARIEAAILAGVTPSVAEQELWMNGGLRVPELFHWLLDHAREYRALVFAPYLFWTTFACAQVAAERSILMPCLHDEPYARLDLFQPLFSGLRGMWFLSEPEHELAHSLFALPATHRVIGAGVAPPEGYETEAFRARHGITGRFVLYAGRREGAKGWERMLSAYAHAVQRFGCSLQLVTMGVGPVTAPQGLEDRVVDLGFLERGERDAAFAAADAYVQPSQYESFSRTIMEAWLAGTIVIANGASAVVRWHCERSGAGLTYDDDEEFAQCLLFVEQAPETAASIAARGRDYVLQHYSPDHVLDSAAAALDEWLPAGAGASE